LVMSIGCAEDAEDTGSVTDDPAKEEVKEDPIPDEPAPPACNPAADVTGTAITGVAYVDENLNDESTFRMGLEEDLDTPLDRFKLTLLGAKEEKTAASCEGGDYGISDIEDGTYVLMPTLPNSQRPCSSRNCPRRFAEAVKEGHVKIVTFGDSIAVVGGQPFFPARLATLLEPLATVDNVNVAVGGTTSPQWLPGTNHFQTRLKPELEDADVVIITLGGNDLLVYIQTLGPAALSDLQGAIDGATDLVQVIMENITETTAEIRKINPDVDVVYCLYPNYGQATSTSPWSLVSGLLQPETFMTLLTTARQAVPADAGFVLADMFGSFEDLTLDDYLFDALHMNEAGANHYAETVFEVLGGVLVGPSPLDSGATPLGLDKSYALVPTE